MLEWWSNFKHAFLYDELAVKRWVRGGGLAVAGILTQVMADPLWTTWSFKQWSLKLIPSVVLFASGSVTATRKNGP